MKRNDILWKGILQDLFEDFLCFIYPNANYTFDFSKGFEFLDKELEQLFPATDDTHSQRFVDNLVKVFLKDGSEKWMLVHIEVQGYADKEFSTRMFQYYTRIFDKYKQPITAWAIFTDANKSYHPTRYYNEVLGTEITYSFNTYKIIEQDATALEASDNPFAVVVLAARLAISNKCIKDEQLFENALELAKFLLKKQMPNDKTRRVMNFLRRYIHFDNRKMMPKFEEEIAILTERSTAMGLEELLLDLAEKKGEKKGEKRGIKKGIELEKTQSQINFTRSLLTSTDFSVEKIAQLVGVSEEFVLKVKKESTL